MTFKRLIHIWNMCFFVPVDPTSIAFFRIVFGLLILADLALLRSDWLVWYGPRGLVTLPTVGHLESATRLSMFAVFPSSERWADGCFWISVLAGVFFTLGFLTRVSSVALFLCIYSIHNRNPYILNSGDTFLRLISFFMMFAPSGALLSVDRAIACRRGTATTVVLKEPWAQRMIQFQMAALYFTTFWVKTQGAAWVGGTALYYVYHIEQLRRFSPPAWFFTPLVVRLGTWFALAIEFSLGVLVWFKEVRYAILLVGIAMHLGIESTMILPLFEWIMMASYLTFVEPADLVRVGTWIRRRVSTYVAKAYRSVASRKGSSVTRT